MSAAGLSFETATRRGAGDAGGSLEEAVLMRVVTAARFERRVDVLVGEGGIIEGSSCDVIPV